MDLTINALDLLLLSLGVLVYAAGATLWTYFAVPAEARKTGPLATSTVAAAQPQVFPGDQRW